MALHVVAKQIPPQGGRHYLYMRDGSEHKWYIGPLARADDDQSKWIKDMPAEYRPTLKAWLSSEEAEEKRRKEPAPRPRGNAQQAAAKADAALPQHMTVEERQALPRDQQDRLREASNAKHGTRNRRDEALETLDSMSDGDISEFGDDPELAVAELRSTILRAYPGTKKGVDAAIKAANGDASEAFGRLQDHARDLGAAASNSSGSTPPPPLGSGDNINTIAARFFQEQIATGMSDTKAERLTREHMTARGSPPGATEQALAAATSSLRSTPEGLRALAAAKDSDAEKIAHQLKTNPPKGHNARVSLGHKVSVSRIQAGSFREQAQMKENAAVGMSGTSVPVFPTNAGDYEAGLRELLSQEWNTKNNNAPDSQKVKDLRAFIEAYKANRPASVSAERVAIVEKEELALGEAIHAMTQHHENASVQNEEKLKATAQGHESWMDDEAQFPHKDAREFAEREVRKAIMDLGLIDEAQRRDTFRHHYDRVVEAHSPGALMTDAPVKPRDDVPAARHDADMATARQERGQRLLVDRAVALHDALIGTNDSAAAEHLVTMTGQMTSRQMADYVERTRRSEPAVAKSHVVDNAVALRNALIGTNDVAAAKQLRQMVAAMSPSQKADYDAKFQRDTPARGPHQREDRIFSKGLIGRTSTKGQLVQTKMPEGQLIEYPDGSIKFAGNDGISYEWVGKGNTIKVYYEATREPIEQFDVGTQRKHGANGEDIINGIRAGIAKLSRANETSTPNPAPSEPVPQPTMGAHKLPENEVLRELEQRYALALVKERDAGNLHWPDQSDAKILHFAHEKVLEVQDAAQTKPNANMVKGNPLLGRIVRDAGYAKSADLVSAIRDGDAKASKARRVAQEEARYAEQRELQARADAHLGTIWPGADEHGRIKSTRYVLEKAGVTVLDQPVRIDNNQVDHDEYHRLVSGAAVVRGDNGVLLKVERNNGYVLSGVAHDGQVGSIDVRNTPIVVLARFKRAEAPATTTERAVEKIMKTHADLATGPRLGEALTTDQVYAAANGKTPDDTLAALAPFGAVKYTTLGQEVVAVPTVEGAAILHRVPGRTNQPNKAAGPEGWAPITVLPRGQVGDPAKYVKTLTQSDNKWTAGKTKAAAFTIPSGPRAGDEAVVYLDFTGRPQAKLASGGGIAVKRGEAWETTTPGVPADPELATAAEAALARLQSAPKPALSGPSQLDLVERRLKKAQRELQVAQTRRTKDAGYVAGEVAQRNTTRVERLQGEVETLRRSRDNLTPPPAQAPRAPESTPPIPKVLASPVAPADAPPVGTRLQRGALLYDVLETKPGTVKLRDVSSGMTVTTSYPAIRMHYKPAPAGATVPTARELKKFEPKPAATAVKPLTVRQTVDGVDIDPSRDTQKGAVFRVDSKVQYVVEPTPDGKVTLRISDSERDSTVKRTLPDLHAAIAYARQLQADVTTTADERTFRMVTDQTKTDLPYDPGHVAVDAHSFGKLIKTQDKGDLDHADHGEWPWEMQHLYASLSEAKRGFASGSSSSRAVEKWAELKMQWDAIRESDTMKLPDGTPVRSVWVGASVPPPAEFARVVAQANKRKKTERADKTRDALAHLAKNGLLTPEQAVSRMGGPAVELDDGIPVLANNTLRNPEVGREEDADAAALLAQLANRAPAVRDAPLRHKNLNQPVPVYHATDVDRVKEERLREVRDAIQQLRTDPKSAQSIALDHSGRETVDLVERAHTRLPTVSVLVVKTPDGPRKTYLTDAEAHQVGQAIQKAKQRAAEREVTTLVKRIHATPGGRELLGELRHADSKRALAAASKKLDTARQYDEKAGAERLVHAHASRIRQDTIARQVINKAKPARGSPREILDEENKFTPHDKHATVYLDDEQAVAFGPKLDMMKAVPVEAHKLQNARVVRILDADGGPAAEVENDAGKTTIIALAYLLNAARAVPKGEHARLMTAGENYPVIIDLPKNPVDQSETRVMIAPRVGGPNGERLKGREIHNKDALEAIRRPFDGRAGSAQPNPIPAGSAAPRAQNFEQYLAERGVQNPGDDHGILSPSGSMSKRARDAMMARREPQWAAYAQAQDEYRNLVDAGAIVDPSGRVARTIEQPKPNPEREQLVREARELRELAERGMKPRAHLRRAQELEAKALTLPETIGKPVASGASSAGAPQVRHTPVASARTAQQSSLAGTPVRMTPDGLDGSPRYHFSTGLGDYVVEWYRGSHGYSGWREVLTTPKTMSRYPDEATKSFGRGSTPEDEIASTIVRGRQLIAESIAGGRHESVTYLPYATLVDRIAQVPARQKLVYEVEKWRRDNGLWEAWEANQPREERLAKAPAGKPHAVPDYANDYHLPQHGHALEPGDVVTMRVGTEKTVRGVIQTSRTQRKRVDGDELPVLVFETPDGHEHAVDIKTLKFTKERVPPRLEPAPMLALVEGQVEDMTSQDRDAWHATMMARAQGMSDAKLASEIQSHEGASALEVNEASVYRSEADRRGLKVPTPSEAYEAFQERKKAEAKLPKPKKTRASAKKDPPDDEDEDSGEDEEESEDADDGQASEGPSPTAAPKTGAKKKSQGNHEVVARLPEGYAPNMRASQMAGGPAVGEVFSRGGRKYEVTNVAADRVQLRQQKSATTRA